MEMGGKEKPTDINFSMVMRKMCGKVSIEKISSRFQIPDAKKVQFEKTKRTPHHCEGKKEKGKGQWDMGR